MATRRPLSPRSGAAGSSRSSSVLVVVAAAAVVSVIALRAAPGAPAAAVAPPAPPRPFRIVFPEGFTRAQMAVRVRDVARIAERRARTSRSRSPRRATCAPRAAARVPCFGGKRYATSRASSSRPPTTSSTDDAARARSSPTSSQAFCERWRSVDLAYARSKNLTPYDVLMIASMVEREAAVPSERRLIAAVIYNRLRDRMQLGIDATLRYGLHIPPDALDHRRASSRAPTPTTRAASTGCRRRRSRTRGSPRSRPPRTRPRSTTSTTRACPGTDRQFFTASVTAFDQLPRHPRLQVTTHVALLGHPVVALALAADAQRRLRRRCGSTGTTRPSTRDDPLAAVAALRTLGFAGTNVTIPHKQAVVAALRRGRGRVGEHARLRRRARARLQHRPRDPRRDRGARAPA